MDAESSFAYIAGALTDVPDERRAALKRLYEQLGDVCVQHGLQGYVPHQHSDPVTHAHLTPREVYDLDFQRVRLCALLIAYVSEPSLGVGVEIAWAGHHQIPIVLVAEAKKCAERKISRLIHGFPNVVHMIGFTDHADAVLQLDAWLAANWQ